METQKILITGGSGFIGTNLVNELTKRGHEVIISDIHHHQYENHEYYRCDVSNFRQVNKLFDYVKNIDYVYHLAAEYGRWNGEEFYENLWQTNVIGTKNIIRTQEKLKFRTIFFSSAEVYGDFQGEMKEEVMISNPISNTYQMNDYAISKWTGELMFMNSERSYNTETVRTRPVNCYGPHEIYHPYRGFIPKFIYHLLNNKPIQVHSGHKRIIDYVEDSCRTWANIIDNFIPGEAYNVGGKVEWEQDIESYANIIASLTNVNSSLINVIPSEADTTIKKTMNFDKAIKDLNHSPKINPEQGIKKTIDWMKLYYNL